MYRSLEPLHKPHMLPWYNIQDQVLYSTTEYKIQSVNITYLVFCILNVLATTIVLVHKWKERKYNRRLF